MFVHFFPKLKDLLFCLHGPGKAESTRGNISRSTIPILEREAYSNLQQAGRPGPEDKRENMIGNRGKKNKTTTNLLISSWHSFIFRPQRQLKADHLSS